MLKYYLVLFARNLQRQRLFSFINLLGLTVSIASTLLIYLYVQNEFSYDRFHPDADRIYRVNQTFIWGEGDNHQFSSTGPGVAVALREELPEAELLTSIHTPGNYVISYTNPGKGVIAFEEEKVLAADSNFFNMFNFPMTAGIPRGALRQTNTLVMTESTAKKYFGDDDPIGKMVRLGKGKDQQTWEVTGVVKDLPPNSYIEFDVLLSLATFHLEKRSWSWVWTQLETFIRLAPGTDVANTRTKLKLIPRKYADVTLRNAMGTTYDEYIKSGKKWDLFLQPMTSIHLPEELVYNRLNDSGNIQIIYSLIVAATFIILLSCINFMNLSTAQFTRRIKEASIRKIMGLGRMELSLNYFVEATAFCLIALVAALGVTQLLLPSFNYITGKGLEMNLFHDTGLIVALFGLVVMMGLLSGSYPAIFLSAFRPVEAIKGRLKTGHEGRTFRNALVVFQFVVSTVLIICTAVVSRQLKFVSEKDLGFDKENLLVVKHVESIPNGESFAKAALGVSGVVQGSWCTSVPPNVYGGDSFSANDKTFPLNFTTADERFISTLKIKLLLGRNFYADTPGDVDRVILNQAALKKIGWNADESVLGKKIQIPREPVFFEVVGVMEDFHYWSLESTIEPMALFHINSKVLGAGDGKLVTLRIAGQSSEAWEKTLAELNSLWKKHAGDFPFSYEFVDDTFEQTFKTQRQFGNALTVMAGLAILIACLGLLGMIIYMLEQRTREIGIRKVTGASAWNIITLVSAGYTRLILLAYAIGAPISYWMMDQWLQAFTFRTTQPLWVFLVAGVAVLLTAILITSYHSVKAALTNPAVVLKDE